MIQGTLNYKEIEFEFILDKENLQLRPKEKFEKKFVECFRQNLGNGAYTYWIGYIITEISAIMRNIKILLQKILFLLQIC